MKKLLLVLALASFSISSYAETLVYFGFIRYEGFIMENSGNKKEAGFTRAYLVVGYDQNTRVFSDATLIKYWRKGGQKFRETVPYTGSVTENVILNAPPGNRVFMKDFIDDNTNKYYEFLDSTSTMVSGRQGIIGSSIPFASTLEGAQITEEAGNLGYRNIRSGTVKLAIAQSITKEVITLPPATAVAGIEAMIEGYGYTPVP